MRRIVLRVLLASLLLLTVASKMRNSADIGSDGLVGNILEVLAEHRISAQANSTQTRAVLPVAVHFLAPGCSGQVDVVPVHINLQEAPLFDVVIKPGYLRLFAYLDRTWVSENRLGMRLTWLRHKVLSIFGLGRFVTITTGLLVVSPPGCHIAQTIDWSLVWDRRTKAGATATQ